MDFNRVNRDAEYQRYQEWLFLTLTLNFSDFFLTSTILILKYNFSTKQKFVGLYTSFFKKMW